MTREELVDAIGEKVAASQDWIGGAQEAYDLVRAALPPAPVQADAGDATATQAGAEDEGRKPNDSAGVLEKGE